MYVLFKDQIIGEITNLSLDFPWILGHFVPNDNYYSYKDFLDFLVDEDATEEPSFDEQLLDETNWFVKDENGLRSILFPAIYEDGTIAISYVRT